MATAAARRIPTFALDFLAGGIGPERNLARNRELIQQIILNPLYVTDRADHPDCTQRVFDTTYSFPFGVAPMGMGDVIWPRVYLHLAAAAKSHRIPFALSGYATSSIEDIASTTGACEWFQHYVTVDKDINSDILRRAEAGGTRVLVITVDVPTATRRRRELRHGLSYPPRVGLSTVADVLAKPRWAWATLTAGIPRLKNLEPYMPQKMPSETVGEFLERIIDTHVSPSRLSEIRQQWSGKLVVKGVLDPQDAIACKELGVDAIWLSNHGGRQFDAAPAPVEVLPSIRQAVGAEVPLFCDSGVRSGLDVARLLARGADFVWLGRAFLYAVAAIGPRGASHVMHVLADEFRTAMGQLGCPSVAELPAFAAPPGK